MINSKEANQIVVNNASQLRGNNFYTSNYLGSSKNKVETQIAKKETNTSPPPSTAPQAQKAKGFSKIITTFTAMISATVVCVVGTDAILPTTIQKAEIQHVFTTESSVEYSIYIEDYNPEDNVYVVLYNDFTNRSEKIEEEYWTGFFENLQKHMTYTLAIKKGSTVLVSMQVKTIFKEPEPYDDTGQDLTEIEREKEGRDPTDTDQPYTSDNPDDYPPDYEPGDNDNPDQTYDPNDPNSTYNPDKPTSDQTDDPEDPNNPDYNQNPDPTYGQG